VSVVIGCNVCGKFGCADHPEPIGEYRTANLPMSAASASMSTTDALHLDVPCPHRCYWHRDQPGHRDDPADFRARGRKKRAAKS